MGSNKLVCHPKKALAMTLVNTPLKLAITTGFHEFHCFLQNACRHKSELWRGSCPLWPSCSAAPSTNNKGMGEPEDYSLFITLHNGLCGKTGKMLSFQLRGQYGAVTVCRLRAGHVLSSAAWECDIYQSGEGDAVS